MSETKLDKILPSMTSSGEDDHAGEVIVTQRELGPGLTRMIYWIAVVMSLFHVWINVGPVPLVIDNQVTLGLIPEIQRNALHFGFILLIGYMLYPVHKKVSKQTLWLDVFLGVLAFCVALYLVLFEDALHARNEVPILSDLIAAGLAIVLMIEITRRTAGWLIPTLAILFLGYALFFGRFFGGLWNFPGVTVERMLYRMYFAPDGIFGQIATISSTFVFLFVLFAAFLLKSGAGEFIIRLAISLLGHTTGGPAKMAVFASGLMGSVSGSAVANTVGTGSITIPMMKNIGFRPSFAGGVEAAASTGGQLMPPIMGAGAFIMAQWTGIPYLTIIGVAFIPAMMYFLSVAFFIHLRAKKRGLKPLNKADLPRTRDVLRDGWHFFIPLGVLVTLLVMDFTPTYAAVYGTASIIAASWMNKKTRMMPIDVVDALALGGRNMVTTGVILLCSGIVVGVVLMVGMGIKFSMMISTIAGGNLFLTVVLIALASLILGMGLPVTASYIVLAVLAAPSLVQLMMADHLVTLYGLTVEQAMDPAIAQPLLDTLPPDITIGALLAAHLLIFWYSQDANVTPPVCLAAYTAAGIAGSKPLETGMESWKLAKGLYIIPLMFIYEPAILFQGPLYLTIENIITGTLGLLIFAAFFEGYFIRELNWLYRFAFAGVAMLLFWPEPVSNYIGIAAVAFFYVWLKYIRPDAPKEQIPPTPPDAEHSPFT